MALGGAYFGEGTGPIFLDDTECSPSNHSMLQECFESEDAATIGEHNCIHGEDVSVICPGTCDTDSSSGLPRVVSCLLTELYTAGNQSCGEYPNGAIRLVGGRTSYEGRVELCLDGEWGTICDNSWTNLDAVVVCRQLSFGLSDATAKSSAFYGEGSGTIHLDRFFCSGDEGTITDCIHAPASSSACVHSQDAGVACSGE